MLAGDSRSASGIATSVDASRRTAGRPAAWRQAGWRRDGRQASAVATGKPAIIVAAGGPASRRARLTGCRRATHANLETKDPENASPAPSHRTHAVETQARDEAPSPHCHAALAIQRRRHEASTPDARRQTPKPGRSRRHQARCRVTGSPASGRHGMPASRRHGRPMSRPQASVMTTAQRQQGREGSVETPGHHRDETACQCRHEVAAGRQASSETEASLSSEDSPVSRRQPSVQTAS